MMFSENRVLVSMPGESRESLLQRMARALFDEGFVKDDFSHSVILREAEYPTGIDMETHSIAIPHAEFEHVIRTGFTITLNHGMVEFHRTDEPEQVIVPTIIVMMAIAPDREKVTLIQSLFQFLGDEETVKKLVRLSSAEVARFFTQAMHTEGEI
ncbi:PTS sugar transporter subunit IIA [Erwinia sp. SLM-02]|uniref:PTS sugar transporter subunit IIA n=1 Tax=Erwinia sp. SLM-02 TaxID=3020057 RepID=UPI003080602D